MPVYHTVKTAISLPRATFQQGETLRRKFGKSRSQLYSEALAAYLKAQEVREMEARYAEGYRRAPEEEALIDAATAASAEILGAEDWA